MSATEALLESRLHNQVVPNISQLERSSTFQNLRITGFSEEMAEALRSKGHQIEWVTSKIMAIAIHERPR
jgi:gamma-glutamyltranspeptidase/glutathione hydrolase